MSRLVLVLALVLGVAGLAPAVSAEAPRNWSVRGVLDLNLAGGDRALEMNGIEIGDSPYDAYRLRLYLAAEISPTVQVYAQSLLDEYHYELVEGAYVQLSPWKDRDLQLLGGKIPTVIGTWEPRGDSKHNPLIGTPLMYGYYTSLSAWGLASTVDDLLGLAGNGAASGGLTMIWDGWWDTGVTAQGSMRPLEFAISASQGTPSTPSPGYDQSPGNSWMGRVGFAPIPAVRLGVSGSTGPFLPESQSGLVPVGHDLKEYRQQLGMADFELLTGPVELHAEAGVSDWGTPTVGTLRVRSGYAEGRLAVGPAAWVAVRADGMRFGDVAGSASTRSWDDDIDRFSIGAGYRVDHGTLAKAEVQRSQLHTASGIQTFDQYAVQLAVRF